MTIKKEGAMVIATTTNDFGAVNDYVKRIEYVCEGGFRYVDLCLWAPLRDDPLFSENWRDHALMLKSLSEEKGFTFVQAHSPCANSCNGEKGFADAVRKSKRAIEICGVLEIPNVVVHPGYGKDLVDKDIWFEENRRFYMALIDDMERCGVNVLCENNTRANVPYGYNLFVGKDMREFIDYLEHPMFGGCWDTGHANIGGNQYDDIIALGNKLYGIHFSDNRGKEDEHTAPFMGTLNVDEVMHALLDVGYKGVFTFEADSILRPASYRHGNRHSFAADSRLAEPPLAVKIQMEKFLFETGKYILNTYGLYEE